MGHNRTTYIICMKTIASTITWQPVYFSICLISLEMSRMSLVNSTNLITWWTPISASFSFQAESISVLYNMKKSIALVKRLNDCVPMSTSFTKNSGFKHCKGGMLIGGLTANSLLITKQEGKVVSLLFFPPTLIFVGCPFWPFHDLRNLPVLIGTWRKRVAGKRFCYRNS